MQWCCCLQQRFALLCVIDSACRQAIQLLTAGHADARIRRAACCLQCLRICFCSFHHAQSLACQSGSTASCCCGAFCDTGYFCLQKQCHVLGHSQISHRTGRAVILVRNVKRCLLTAQQLLQRLAIQPEQHDLKILHTTLEKLQSYLDKR